MEKQLWLFDDMVAKPNFDTLVFVEQPKNDNDLLLNYQYLFLVKKDRKAWGNLWLLSRKIVRRIMRKIMKEKKLSFTREDFEDKVMNAVEYVLRRYSTNPFYYVKDNFISVLKGGVLHALWYMNNNDVFEAELVKVMNHYKLDPEHAMFIASEITVRRSQKHDKGNSVRQDLQHRKCEE